MKQLKERLHGFLEGNREKRLVITSHSNFDLDALCCCYAMKSVLPNSIMALPDKMEAPAKELSDSMGMELADLGKLKKEEFEGLVVVDCSTSVLLEGAKGWDIKLVIDHHHKSENNLKEEVTLRDEHAPSTAEMLGEMLPEISADVAFVLGIAIVSDTARFKSGRASTFSTLAKMMEISGKEYPEMLERAEPEVEAMYKVSILEGFRNARISVHGGYVVVTSVVPDHESLVSSAMSEFADVAFVGKWKGELGETRISARARKHVEIKMNEVMQEAAGELGGGGGGHAKAAGCSAKGRPPEVLNKCVEIFVGKLQ